MNTTGINPIQYYVVVRVLEAAKTTASGLILPDEEVAKQQFAMNKGMVVAIGAACFTNLEEFPIGSDIPEVGDVVCFKKYGGTQIEDDQGVVHRILEDRNVIGVMDVVEGLN